MTKHIVAASTWRTGSFTESTETSPMELSILGEHLNGCKGSHRHLLALHGAAERVHGFVATRFVTTLAIVATLIGIGFVVF